MIPVPSGVRVWLATGVTDMRRGMNRRLPRSTREFQRWDSTGPQTLPNERLVENACAQEGTVQDAATGP